MEFWENKYSLAPSGLRTTAQTQTTLAPHLSLTDQCQGGVSAGKREYQGATMQDLVNRLQSAQDLTHQLLVRL